MKLPELPKRKPSSGAGRSGMQPPAFIGDLYKDMRDRRLLIPALALLVAIFALPFLLGSDTPPPPSAPAAAEDPDAVAVEPAVLAVQETGIRNFESRLDNLEPKNPFGDKFLPKPEALAKDGELLDAEDAGGTTSGGEAQVAEPASSGTAPAPESPASAPASAPEPQEPFVLVPRVDVTIGIMGRDQKHEHENVHTRDVLPSRRAPVAMYVGNSDNSEEAGFIVSRDVSRVNGDGACKPSRNNCEFLGLADGETAYLRYADGHRYSLRVTDIYFVRIPESEFKDGD
jgi:hypothetical protein